MVALLMLVEVLLATFSMMVSCTSFPAAAGAPRVYVPLKSLEGAAKALSANASNAIARIRRDVRAEIMGFLHWTTETKKQNNDSRIKMSLGIGARKGLSSYPINRVAILLQQYLITQALRASWRPIKLSNVCGPRLFCALGVPHASCAMQGMER